MPSLKVATTLFDRFPIVMRLDYYDVDEMMPILKTAAKREGIDLGAVVANHGL